MKPDRTVGVRITHIARLLRTRFDGRARELGLTRAQWHAIVAIHWNEGLTQRELAEKLEIGSVAAGRLIERLEQSGWVERRHDPADRRAYLLRLGTHIEPTLELLSIIGADEERRTLAGLSEIERATFTEILDRIISNLGEPCASNFHQEEATPTA
jgi:MarR family transcriptional regulator for hemolysin